MVRMQVYSAAGRQLLPSIALGSVPRYLAAGAAWQLMAVCADASVRLWDLQAERLLVRASLSALRSAEGEGWGSSPGWRPHVEDDRRVLRSGHAGAVVGARLTEGGSPLVMLADGSAYMLHLGLREWLCIVDPTFAASSYASMFSAGSAAPAGELSATAPVSPWNFVVSISLVRQSAAGKGLIGSCVEQASLGGSRQKRPQLGQARRVRPRRHWQLLSVTAGINLRCELGPPWPSARGRSTDGGSSHMFGTWQVRAAGHERLLLKAVHGRGNATS